MSAIYEEHKCVLPSLTSASPLPRTDLAAGTRTASSTSATRARTPSAHGERASAACRRGRHRSRPTASSLVMAFPVSLLSLSFADADSISGIDTGGARITYPRYPFSLSSPSSFPPPLSPHRYACTILPRRRPLLRHDVVHVPPLLHSPQINVLRNRSPAILSASFGCASCILFDELVSCRPQ